ncbi:MAG: hypothetical protein RIS86_819 [Planctomycetota bacterium]|jgi:hypothetical protein
MRKIRTAERPEAARAHAARGARVAAPAMALLCLPFLCACRSAPEASVPARGAVHASLAGAPDPGADAFASRNDERLGARRGAFVRIPERIESATFDRQWILNGRPFDRYRTTTVTRERLAR